MEHFSRCMLATREPCAVGSGEERSLLCDSGSKSQLLLEGEINYVGNLMYWIKTKVVASLTVSLNIPSHLALHLSHRYVTSRRFSAGGATLAAIEVALFGERTCFCPTISVVIKPQ